MRLLSALLLFPLATLASPKPLLTEETFKAETRIIGAPADYTFKDGVLSGSGKHLKSNSFLTTKAQFTNFTLTFEMKFDTLEGNSGVMFRALIDEEKNRLIGYQCEHDNKDRSWTAGLYDESRRGWLFPMKANAGHGAAFTKVGQEIFRKDGWNQVTIECRGAEIVTRLNGKERVHFIDVDEKHQTLSGHIGFQVHSGKSCAVSWRNITIEELE